MTDLFNDTLTADDGADLLRVIRTEWRTYRREAAKDSWGA